MLIQRLGLVVAACLLAACPATVTTTSGGGDDRRPSRPPPDRPRPDWDSTGWTLLGSQWVDGNIDKDVFKIKPYDSRLTALTMVVTESDLDLLEFVVVFGNGERFSPALKHTFREGQRARAIDLPGDTRKVVQIETTYKNRRGGGRAKVEIYGKEGAAPVVTRPPDPPPPPPEPEWSPKGWELLGTQTVEGKRDRDTYKVGRQAGKFDRIMVVVKDSDLEMLDFVVTFENGTKFEPKLKYTFKEGTRTRPIDLPGGSRKIKQIDVKYANLPGGGKARVEIYGRDTSSGGGGGGAPMPPAEPEWDSKGWTLLGSQTVEGKRDKDTYPVGKAQGKFQKIMIVVKDSDLEMLDFVVTFENNTKFEPKLKYTFKEGTRTRPIDLPGATRKIKQIDVRYANLPGGGKARVEIYGK